MTVPEPVRPASSRYLDAVLDPGSFRSWDTPAGPPPGASTGYRAELDRARARAGTDESVVTGEGRAGGLRVAVVCSEFGFLAGSVGTVAAARIVAAAGRATTARLPLVLAPASGGTRMQDGAAAFLAMSGIARAVAAHRRAGLPVVVHLRHPTTGGSLASWGSLGSVTVAEPGALVGFLGPKVYRGLTGSAFPDGVQTAENLYRHGVVDAVLDTAGFAGFLRRVVALTRHAPTPVPPAPEPGPAPGPVPDAWTSVTATRRPDRPGVRDLLTDPDTVLLHGTGAGETAAATVLCLTRFGTSPCVLVGQDRTATRPVGPADLRVARRGARLAGELGLPLVTVVDTAGAELSPAAEQGALAGEIARCLAGPGGPGGPVVSVLLGQGGGGAALALLPADRVLAARHAWLTPLPPEGASVIVHGTPDRAPETVAAQRVRSADLLALGAVDRIVEECPDAADEPAAFVARMRAALAEEIPRAVGTHPPPISYRPPRPGDRPCCSPR
ncbi:carboxyl transferase domain-containing protein [Pseudonocardia sp. ICBG162]|uniref:carboxyl transferase domain-containing protein n=1 Tax=Pseudonocardia sp. ICBG162 TaxID=2846761 RepID=UPI001CF6A788|nr:carboxyl transferase domain-containing protein [Pseudonocardia sp. ICBG162]